MILTRRALRPLSRQNLKCFAHLGAGGSHLSSLRLQAVWFATTPTKMRAVYAEGGKAVMREVEVPQPGPGEILLKVEAAGVNRADCVQRMGNYPPPPGASDILGLEVVGRVHALGPGVEEHAFGVGDQMMSILTGGGYADFCVVPAKTLIHCPTSLGSSRSAPSPIDLCAIPETWLTAYQLLMFVGKAQEGEVILVHAGASNVGLAAVQMAMSVTKSIPIVTCSAGKMEAVRGVGVQHVIDRNANDGDWKEAVKLAANEARSIRGFSKKNGVDLVLDPVGGSYWSRNAAVLAVDGRLVVYGLMGGAKVQGIILGDILSKRLQVIGTTIRTRSVDYKSEVSKRFTEEVLPHLVSGSLNAPVSHVMPLTEAEEALNLMMTNSTVGKIVLQP